MLPEKTRLYHSDEAGLGSIFLTRLLLQEGTYYSLLCEVFFGRRLFSARDALFFISRKRPLLIKLFDFTICQSFLVN
jgi:hypothetical protein